MRQSLESSSTAAVTQARLNQWNNAKLCIPTEGPAVIYDTEHTISCELPDFVSLSPGVNLSDVPPVRSWSGLSQFSEKNSDHGSSTAIYDPFSAKRLDLYYFYTGSSSVVIAITLSADTSNSELHV